MTFSTKELLMDKDMIQGFLSVNLEPPYVTMRIDRKNEILKPCTLDEIRMLLLSLNAIDIDQNWPPAECVIRVCGRFSRRLLAQFGLVPPLSLLATFPLEKQNMALSASQLSS
ncbi:MAG: hypothetical protein K2W82_04725 [Candidatus Obscuribacterales bacterium]|nr:hypothetical protein [Candidatus Obscuribacterales bacterium]